MNSRDLSAPIEDADIRAAVRKIVASEPFRGQEMRSRFLEFIVEEHLAGRASRIKGTTIALEVYGRDADFDPQSDPIVRVEARKLRRELELYYLTEGVDETIFIDVPKGGYTPVISKIVQDEKTSLSSPSTANSNSNETGQSDKKDKGLKLWSAKTLLGTVLAVAAVLGVAFYLFNATKSDERAHVSGPTLFVTPFLPSSGTSEENSLARGLTIETTNALIAFDDLKVYPVGLDYQFATVDLDVKDVAYILSGTVQLVSNEMRVTAQLLQANDGQLVWSERFVSDLVPDQIFEIQQKIAESVAKELAEPFALLGQLSQRQLANNNNPSLYSYECVLKGYEYRATFQNEKHLAARNCLEEAVRRDPDYSRAWALLTYIYIDEYRFFYNQLPGAYVFRRPYLTHIRPISARTTGH